MEIRSNRHSSRLHAGSPTPNPAQTPYKCTPPFLLIITIPHNPIQYPTTANMGFTVEYESSVAAPRMFKAAVLDWHNLGPKVAPNIIASGSLVQGTGGIGTVRQINFTEVMPFSYVKERLDFVDEGNLEAKWTIIEGGHLRTTLDGATAHYNFRQTDTGGCVCKVVTETRIKAGVGARTSDEEAKAKDGLKKQFKATETYLLDHPDVYA